MINISSGASLDHLEPDRMPIFTMLTQPDA